MITVTTSVEDLDLMVIALLRFVGAERINQPAKAARASILARELGQALNRIDPDNETNRPVVHVSRMGPVPGEVPDPRALLWRQNRNGHPS